MKKIARKKNGKAGKVGSSFDDFLKDDGIYENIAARAIKRVIARQLDALMKREAILQDHACNAAQDQPHQVDRLLDPENQSVTLQTLTRAAHAVGRTLHLELV